MGIPNLSVLSFCFSIALTSTTSTPFFIKLAYLSLVVSSVLSDTLESIVGCEFILLISSTLGVFCVSSSCFNSLSPIDGLSNSSILFITFVGGAFLFRGCFSFLVLFGVGVSSVLSSTPMLFLADYFALLKVVLHVHRGYIFHIYIHRHYYLHATV
jgi:hypothetical protein